ncbi:MAG: GNAT family N-acetyltransferase [Acidimicrobiales bacterium]
MLRRVGGFYAAWVAEIGGQVVGHVALQRHAAPEVTAVARQATGTTDGALAVVARLLVSPIARRRGVGRALLATAAGAATALGLRPIIDVGTRYQPAIELYEAVGWVRVGTTTLRLPDRTALDELVYLGPEPHAA